MHMRFLSRGFKNLQWYSMTKRNTIRKDGVSFWNDAGRLGLAASTCAKRVKSRGEAGLLRMAVAIRGMPGSEFEPRRGRVTSLARSAEPRSKSGVGGQRKIGNTFSQSVFCHCKMQKHMLRLCKQEEGFL